MSEKQIKVKPTRNKKVVYYNNEEKENLIIKINKKKDKITEQEIELNAKIEELYNHPQVKEKSRLQRKIVKSSTKLTSLKVKVKSMDKQLNELSSNGDIVKDSAYVKFKKWFSSIKYTNQVKIWGGIFIIPWIVGMLLFFLPSLFQTFYWSFNSVSISQGITTTNFIGFENFINLFTKHVIDNSNVFSVSILTFMKELLIDLPIIIIFSILIAVLLNKEFKGHKLIKAIFFVPVIYNLAVITETLTGNYGSFISNSMDDMLFVNQITGFFREIGVAESLMDIVLNAIERIFTIVNLSGIQILIFIAAIQSIPTHLYEAAEIEGASKYETFWKITVPMIMPMILTAAVFTVVESFTRAPIFRFLDYAISDGNYGLASAISFSYFIINLAIIGLIFLLFKGRVFYYDDKK